MDYYIFIYSLYQPIVAWYSALNNEHMSRVENDRLEDDVFVDRSKLETIGRQITFNKID
jgi:hypothetical protein